MNNEYVTEAVFAQQTEENNDFSTTELDSLPLAMAYVPMQKWRNVYDPDVALDRGTAFAELDKPFLGRQALENDR